MRRRLVLIALLGLLVPAAARAQYFGQNKVQYRTFDWHVIETQHFEVHYYGSERQAALDASRMAERAYARLSRILQHEFQEKKPIILYQSQSDFAQTNTTEGDLGEGTGGFTDFARNRMVLPFTGSYADFEHVLQHEMVHAFQYDIFSHGHAGAGLQTISAVNPSLWFMEGMAEYLSIGPVDPHTAMWMRDAAIHGRMPTIEQLTYDNRYFPYRYGHALWAYIGQKWGDESIGAILQGTLSGGIEHSFQRVLGISLENLGDEWVEAVQNTYLPQLPDQQRPRAMSHLVLNERNSGGGYHVSPQVSPDGSRVVYLSERNFFFVDMYIADVATGKKVQKLVQSSLNANFESLRFINSTGAWSPDGREFLFVSKNRGEDVLNILDVRHRNLVGRLRLGMVGITNPSWSPDGSRIVFTGFNGGWSNLFLVNRDGSDLRQLTDDAYADLMPTWSPDGQKIAFCTDRGPDTDFSMLRFGNLRIALYWLDGDSIQVLDRMDEGKNVNPVWAPDGQSLAFLSSRTGINNVFLYDFGAHDIYQITRAYTGITGITDLSPAISWARDADRMAITYYEDGAYNVYTIDNPRALKREPYRSNPAQAIQYANAAAQPLRLENALGSQLRRPPVSDAPSMQSAAAAAAPAPNPATLPGPVAPPPTPASPTPSPTSGSIYRQGGTLRPSDTEPAAAAAGGPAPLSVASLLDSAELALPDTSEFHLRPYKVHYAADFVSRPTIGYARDNFGRGFFGGAAIQLSDLLGDHLLSFAGSINGRISEAQIFAAYVNLAHRWNWSVGGAQEVYYYYSGNGTVTNTPSGDIVSQPLDRWIARQLFAQAIRPFNRFQRFEASLYGVDLYQSTLNRITQYDLGGIPRAGFDSISNGRNTFYAVPSAALVYDNSLFGYTSTFYGTRYRLEVGQAIGGYQYTQLVGDYRKYISLGFPWTLAGRITSVGRFGRDENIFPLFLGTPDRVRGYTYGSYVNNECGANGTQETCAELNRLIGSRMAVATAEFRFPLIRGNALGFLPIALPPIEGAVWYDAGISWTAGNSILWSRPANPTSNDRWPLTAYGASIRINLLGFVILNIDYAVPRTRPGKSGYWILSLNPPF